MMYIKRLADEQLTEHLSSAGAVLIRGPKACGKTETAKQVANSILEMDQDPQVEAVMAIDPAELLIGKTPRLIDEWQIQPKLWNYIRHEVDNRQKTGQFILTGSANPNEDASLHSGAGRFTIINMRTLTWQELGYSDGSISLKNIFNGETVKTNLQRKTTLDDILKRIIRGGWPALVNADEKAALNLNRAYVNYLAEVDMSRVSEIRRDPLKVKALLRSLARNIATPVDAATLIKDMGTFDATATKPTVYDYMDSLERVMILENQPVFNLHIRSAAALRKTPKRHFTDTSLAVAALNLNLETLKNDLNYAGFLFEDLVWHNLKAYAEHNHMEVSYYRDSYDNEIDIVVSGDGGKLALFEVKLGMGATDKAVETLLKIAQMIKAEKYPKVSLNVITGTGFAHTRPDGVNVIPLACLGA